MSFVPRHSSVVPARVKAARVAATGLATAVVSTGIAVSTTSSANASTGGGSVWDRVAACESGGNWSINTGNGFSGGLQFTPSTWRAYGGQGSAHNASRAEQIRVAQRVLAGQGPGAWPVCSRKAGLTSGNGGSASSYDSGVSSSRSSHRKAVSTTSTRHRSESSSHRSERRSERRSTRLEASTARPTKTVDRVSVKHHGKASSVGHGLRSQVRTIQRELGVSADGILGPITTRAIQKYVGVAQDGIAGPVTVAAVEKKLGLTASGASRLGPKLVKALAAGLAH